MIFDFALKPHLIYARDVFPLQRITFSEHSLPAPNNYKSVLTGLYGDYMRIPAEEDRVTHYSSVEVF